MTRPFPRLFCALWAVAAAGCGGAAPARCPLTVWLRAASLPAASAPLELVGSWDGWSRPGVRSFRAVTADDGSAWQTATIDLAPGRYQYAIVAGPARLTDALNPRTTFVPDDMDPFGAEVSEIELADCTAPSLTVTAARAEGDALVVDADFAPGSGALDRGSPAATLTRAGAPVAAAVTVTRVDQAAGRAQLTARAAGLAPGKYTLTLRARDGAGRPLSATASAFVATPPGPATLGDGLVYQVMLDRFRGAGGAALAAPVTPGERAGGTLDGVRAALDAGYFEALGVTTLWLSPVYTNPDGDQTGRDGHPVTPYHGYWPEAARAVDPRLGGEAALDALVADAHARGVRVILDVVPNHVFDAHPYFADHSRKSPSIARHPAPHADPGTISWFNDGDDACVCGDPGCDWGAHMETCWFAPYLPDLNWRHPDLRAAAAGDLGWWTSRFDLDGLRIDAVPMMPRAAARTIVRTVAAEAWRAPGDRLVIGEIFTGPGDAGRAQIRAYLGAAYDGLDSAFDFPLMWTLRDVVAHGVSGFDAVEADVQAAGEAFAGAGATVAHMIGNHDTTRFLSEANGDAGGDPWSAPPAQPVADEPYRRQLVALAFVLTQPGLPVLYYGDEVGLAGGADPDSRRVLPARAALSNAQQRLADAVGAIGRARRCSAALRPSEGGRTVALVDADHDVALLARDGETAAVVLSRARHDATLDVAGLPAGGYRDVVAGGRIQSDGAHAAVPAPALSAAVYLREDSPCLQ